MTAVLPTNPQHPAEKLRVLGQLTSDMALALRAQRDLIALRGIQVPAAPLDNLQQVSADLKNMAENLGDTQRELQQLRELARTTEVINSMLDLDLVLNHVIDTVISLTESERGYIVLKDPGSGKLEFRVARNFRQADLTQGSGDFIVSDTVVKRVAETGDPIVTTNAQEDTRFQNSDSIANYMLRSILCVPLKRKGEVKGVIYTDNRMRPGLFSEREQRLVYAFANQAAIAIDNARLFERVRASLAEITALKEFMDNVFDSIASGVIAADSDDQITTINAAAARILDIPREQSVGKSLWSVLPTLYEGFEKLVKEVRDRNRQQTIEVDPVLDRRGQISLDLKLSPLKDEAQVTQGVALVLDDRTELKQREAQLNVVRRYLPPAMVDNIQSIDRLELGGVEREISVLFCDVRGFTTFSESLPPEQLMQVINRYLSLSSDAINKYEGIIDKYMGDAVVGLFNTQLNPQESDHPVRAAYAALTMVHNVLELHKALPPEQRLLYGIGVHTGTAVLGNVGSPRRKEFTAIGDTVQIAKLLQEYALGGQVIISQEAYDVLKNYVKAERIEPHKLKDQRDYRPMYLVVGLVQ